MTHEQTISKRTPLSYSWADDEIKILFYVGGNMTINKGKMDKNSKEDKEWSIKTLKTTLKKLSSMQPLYVVLFIIAGWSNSEGADDTSYAYRYLDNYYPEEIDKIMANLYKERM